MDPIALTVGIWIARYASEAVVSQLQASSTDLALAKVMRMSERFIVKPPESSPLPRAIEASFRDTCTVLADGIVIGDDPRWATEFRRLARDEGAIRAFRDVHALDTRAVGAIDDAAAAQFSAALESWVAALHPSPSPLPGAVLSAFRDGVRVRGRGSARVTPYQLYIESLAGRYRQDPVLRAEIDGIRSQILQQLLVELLARNDPAEDTVRTTAALDLYAHEVLRRHGSTAVPFLADRARVDDGSIVQRRVDLDRIFIDLPLEPPSVEHARAADGPDRVSWGQYVRNEQEQAQAERGGGVDQKATHSIATCLARDRRILVMGAPGSGKSCIARFLAAHYARRWLSGPAPMDDGATPAARQLADALPPRQWLPILVPCREVRTGTGSLAGLIDEVLANLELGSKTRAIVGDELLERLRLGDALLIVDGLDECPRQLLFELPERLRLAEHVVVTSRHTGLGDVVDALSEVVVTYQISELRLEHKVLFATAWDTLCASLPGVEDRRGELETALARRELEKITSSIQLLTLVAAIHTADGTIERRRDALFRRAIKDLLSQRSLASGTVEIRDVWPGMLALAWSMQAAGAHTWGCSRAEQAVDRFFQRCREHDEVRAHLTTRLPTGRRWLDVAVGYAILRQEASKDLVPGLDPSGLFPDADGMVEFYHLVFQEYCAAAASMTVFAGALDHEGEVP